MPKMRFLSVAAVLASGLVWCTLLFSCAKQGYPSGGPKDVTPPVVLGAQPPSGTLGWTAREFLIQFDEYVTVKDAENNILVSPPMSPKPEYGTKGRGILVKIKDTLRAETTYLFQFKGGIADFNEGNVLESHEYVFSTGSHIDSMTLRGRVLDAFTQQPRTETVTVLAYAEQSLTDSLGDSLVAKQQPLYLTRCDKEGRFALNHLRQGSYLLLAIEDGDKNMRLTGDEPVAFLDSLVQALPMPKAPDTTATDSTAADSTALPQPPLAEAADTASDSPSLTLWMSQHKNESQRITDSRFDRKGRITLITHLPLSPHYTLRPIDTSHTPNTPLLYSCLNPRGDTLRVWTAQPNCDSIVLLLADSTGLSDTLRLQYREKAMGKRSPSLGARQTKPSSIMRSRVGNSHPYYDTLWLEFDNPIALDNPSPDSAVDVLCLADSSLRHCGLRPDTHSASQAVVRAYLDWQGQPGQKYQFTLPKGLMRDIYGNPSDSLTFTTEYTKPESYGNIYIDLTTTDTLPLIVQLTNEKGDVLRQVRLSVGDTTGTPRRLSFTHLKGGKYSVRAIQDADGNGQWTAGLYWQHRQPEKVLVYGKTLELREKWDMEEKWHITW